MTRRHISPLHITSHPYWLFSSNSILCHVFYLILCFLKACYLILAFKSMMTETQTPFLSAFSSLRAIMCCTVWLMNVNKTGGNKRMTSLICETLMSPLSACRSSEWQACWWFAGRTEPHTYAHIKSSFISHITAADQCPEKGMRWTNLERRLNATLLLNESDLSPSLGWESLLKIMYLESFILYVLKSFN